MLNYQLNEIQQEVVDLAREIAENDIKPVRAEYDKNHTFPWPVMKKCAQAGLFGLFVPEQYGGMVPEGSKGVTELSLAVEELSKACGSIAISYAGSALGSFPIILEGTEEQKEKYLPEIAEGKKLAAFGLTEANAGSDALAMQTSAKKDGDYYILNGTKQWITNGGEADVYTVFAITDRARGARGLSCFIVEKGWEGFSFGKNEEKLGINSSATTELIFDDVKVPAANLLGGKVGMGVKAAIRTLNHSRPGVGAQALGIAAGALNEAVNYAKERVQFGKKILEFQAIQHILADAAMQIEAARALIYSVARAVDAGQTDFAPYSAMAKCYASDVAMKVTTDMLQVAGGYGYMKEYPFEKYFRDAKITQIYEGTNQIQRNEIALGVIRESVKKK
jgi:butyryl-CoA dehydrogenase